MLAPEKNANMDTGQPTWYQALPPPLLVSRMLKAVPVPNTRAGGNEGDNKLSGALETFCSPRRAFRFFQAPDCATSS
jgi:hypothetical protein